MRNGEDAENKTNGEKEFYMRKSYYAAANTENGFVNLFGSIFSERELSRLYIIKGGPGTGKSTFMNEIASKAEERGYDTEYYYCSADTSSLDGIKIPALSVAVIDGTSPHMTDPKYPGAVGKIINIGENFDAEYLAENKREIITLTEKCSEFYNVARRFLEACGKMERARIDIAEKSFKYEKAKKAALRLLSQYTPSKSEKKSEKNSEKYSEKYISAIGIRGGNNITHINVSEQYGKIVNVGGKYCMDVLFMGVLFETAAERGFSVTRFPNVLLKDRTEGVYISEADVLFVIGDKDDADINAMRFADNEKISLSRQKLRFAEKCAISLLDGAKEALLNMGKTHDELERYYINAMDFSGNDEMLDNIEKEIFGA